MSRWYVAFTFANTTCRGELVPFVIEIESVTTVNHITYKNNIASPVIRRFQTNDYWSYRSHYMHIKMDTI